MSLQFLRLKGEHDFLKDFIVFLTKHLFGDGKSEQRTSFFQTASEHFSDGKYLDLLTHILDSNKKHTLYWKKSYVNSILHLLAELCSRLEGDDQKTGVNKIIAHIKKHKPNQTNYMLKALSCLYNCFEESNQVRFDIFTNLLNVVHEIKRIDLIVPYTTKINQMIDQWKLEKSDWVALYKNLIYKFQEYPDNVKELSQVYTSFLKRYENSSDEDILVDQDFITSTVLNLVLKGFKQLNLNLLFLVKSVKVVFNNNTFLKEFTAHAFSGGVQEYKTWSAKNEDNFKKVQVKSEDFLSHVKMFTLQRLGQKNRILKFADIANDLQIDQDSIEAWVLKTIKHGLIQGKVDEFNSHVYVSSTSKVWADKNYEKQLLSEVSTLRKNFQHILGDS